MLGIMTQPLTSQIEHIVVVMFENRSFDNVLGSLYPSSDTFDGLTGSESNPINPYSPDSGSVHVWQGTSGIETMIMPFPDPNEDFNDMTQQLFGCNWASATGASTSITPTMDGFVWNYLTAPSLGGVNPSAIDIMQYYAGGSDGNMPVTSALAAAYTISDRWFASGPVQTFANRIFNHCATPGIRKSGKAYLNDHDYGVDIAGFGGVDCASVFSTLDAALPKGKINWKIYYQDEAEVCGLPGGILSALLVKYVREVFRSSGQQQVVQYNAFETDVDQDTLPAYSFIEPRYFAASEGPAQSNHPGNAIEPGTSGNPTAISVCDGEAFLADIYNTLSARPQVFAKTLLVVIYDEHGGVYDHVPPPAAPSPFASDVEGFDYSRYGVRVPCLLINPYVNRGYGVAYRPPGSGNPFDHTTIIQTVIQQFLPPDDWTTLTNRDAAAPVLVNLIDPGNTPIPNVTLPSLTCPSPITFTDGPTAAHGPRQKLVRAILKAQKEGDTTTS